MLHGGRGVIDLNSNNSESINHKSGRVFDLGGQNGERARTQSSRMQEVLLSLGSPREPIKHFQWSALVTEAVRAGDRAALSALMHPSVLRELYDVDSLMVSKAVYAGDRAAPRTSRDLYEMGLDWNVILSSNFCEYMDTLEDLFLFHGVVIDGYTKEKISYDGRYVHAYCATRVLDRTGVFVPNFKDEDLFFVCRSVYKIYSEKRARAIRRSCLLRGGVARALTGIHAELHAALGLEATRGPVGGGFMDIYARLPEELRCLVSGHVARSSLGALAAAAKAAAEAAAKPNDDMPRTLKDHYEDANEIVQIPLVIFDRMNFPRGSGWTWCAARGRLVVHAMPHADEICIDHVESCKGVNKCKCAVSDGEQMGNASGNTVWDLPWLVPANLPTPAMVERCARGLRLGALV